MSILSFARAIGRANTRNVLAGQIERRCRSPQGFLGFAHKRRVEPPILATAKIAEQAIDRRNQVEPSEDLGGAYRDRTDDPLLAKQMLSQLS